MSDYPQIGVTRKSGDEIFTEDGEPVGGSLLNFWQWMGSGLIDNTFRGVLAEYVVALALGIADHVCNSWEPCDLITESGLRIEVKSSAYLQSWTQKKLSQIIFSIAHTRNWDAEAGVLSPGTLRDSDVYVFCLLKHKDQATLNPLQLEQWDFYVLPTETLNEQVVEQKSISLSSLLKLGPTEATFSSLSDAILNAGSRD